MWLILSIIFGILIASVFLIVFYICFFGHHFAKICNTYSTDPSEENIDNGNIDNNIHNNQIISLTSVIPIQSAIRLYLCILYLMVFSCVFGLIILHYNGGDKLTNIMYLLQSLWLFSPITSAMICSCYYKWWDLENPHEHDWSIKSHSSFHEKSCERIQENAGVIHRHSRHTIDNIQEYIENTQNVTNIDNHPIKKKRFKIWNFFKRIFTLKKSYLNSILLSIIIPIIYTSLDFIIRCSIGISGWSNHFFVIHVGLIMGIKTCLPTSIINEYNIPGNIVNIDCVHPNWIILFMFIYNVIIGNFVSFFMDASDSFVTYTNVNRAVDLFQDHYPSIHLNSTVVEQLEQNFNASYTDLGIGSYFFYSICEEVGWAGWLYPCLLSLFSIIKRDYYHHSSKISNFIFLIILPAFTTGIIWVTWHMPIILSSYFELIPPDATYFPGLPLSYDSQSYYTGISNEDSYTDGHTRSLLRYAMLMFELGCVADRFIMCWICRSTSFNLIGGIGTVWTSVVYHGVTNLFSSWYTMLSFYKINCSEDDDCSSQFSFEDVFFYGEASFIVIIIQWIIVMIVLYIWRREWINRGVFRSVVEMKNRSSI